jgi:hypothetical protein
MSPFWAFMMTRNENVRRGFWIYERYLRAVAS